MMKKYSKLLKGNYLKVFFTAAAFLMPIISAILSVFHPEARWFSRSGSLTVLCSAIVQFKLEKQLQSKLNRERHTDQFMVQPGEVKLSVLGQYLDRISLILIIVGTLIWGYGDLFFPN